MTATQLTLVLDPTPAESLPRSLDPRWSWRRTAICVERLNWEAFADSRRWETALTRHLAARPDVRDVAVGVSEISTATIEAPTDQITATVLGRTRQERTDILRRLLDEATEQHLLTLDLKAGR